MLCIRAWQVITILLSTYFVINLYCAVITISFQTQREKAGALAKAEKARKLEGITIGSVVIIKVCQR